MPTKMRRIQKHFEVPLMEGGSDKSHMLRCARDQTDGIHESWELGKAMVKQRLNASSKMGGYCIGETNCCCMSMETWYCYTL